MSMFSSPEDEKLHADLVAKFGELKAGIRPGEEPRLYFERVQNDGLLHVTTRAQLKDLRVFQAAKTAEHRGALVHIVEPSKPDVLEFAKPKTLDDYKTAKASAARARKELAFA